TAAQPSSRTLPKIEHTVAFQGAEVATDPKSQVVPVAQVQRAKSQAMGGKRAKKPPLVLIAGGAAAALVILALGVWVIVRDKSGKEVAKVNVPAGGTVEVQTNQPTKAASVSKPVTAPKTPPAPVISPPA